MKNTYRITYRASYMTGGAMIRVATSVIVMAASAGLAVTVGAGKLTGPIVDYGLTADSISIKLVKPRGR